MDIVLEFVVPDGTPARDVCRHVELARIEALSAHRREMNNRRLDDTYEIDHQGNVCLRLVPMGASLS